MALNGRGGSSPLQRTRPEKSAGFCRAQLFAGFVPASERVSERAPAEAGTRGAYDLGMAAVAPSTLELLDWVSGRPRSYAGGDGGLGELVSSPFRLGGRTCRAVDSGLARPGRVDRCRSRCARARLTPSGGVSTLVSNTRSRKRAFAHPPRRRHAHRTAAGDLAVPDEYVGRHGYPPTVREIGESVGLASPSTVHAHLANLERAGYLKRDPTKPRALELLRAPAGRRRRARPRCTSCRCSARSPPARRCSRRRTSTTTSRCPSRSHAAARTSCSASAATRWSTPGSSTATSSSSAARRTRRNGEIVAALVGDDESANEATVKRFFREGSRVRLQPENDALEPIYVDRTSRSSARSWGSSGAL